MLFRSRTDLGDTKLILIDLGAGKNRMGGSALAQVYGAVGNQAPDVDDAARLKNFFATIQALNSDGKLLAYHDRSDGGLFSTLVEMAFAGHCGLQVTLDGLPGDVASVLYNEELGAVIQVRASEAEAIAASLTQALPNCVHVIGDVTNAEAVNIKQAGDRKSTRLNSSH